MSKNRRKKPAAKGQRKQSAFSPNAASPTTRRAMLRNIVAFGAVGVAVAGGVGFLAHGVMASVAEADLDVIGQGVPVIVQIHDPSCPDCTRLQREARAAMRNFNDDQLLYRVANLTTEKGARFAAGHGQGRVTLILLNAQGRRVQVVNGVHDRQSLAQDFALLAAD